VIRINLLPHREQKRQERRKYFFILAGVVAVAAIVVVGMVHVYFSNEIATQDERNDFLKKENAKLDKEIEEIKKLKEETDRLLARKEVIEKLQGDRAEPVILLDQLARRVPDGVYLKAVRQESGKVMLNGYAQSSARVSTLMRNIDSSEWMQSSELVEIKAVMQDKRRLNEFSVNFKMKRPKAEEAKKKEEAAKPAAPPAAPAPGAAPAK
jgi:type IV pilus assembly protein PilN